MPYFSSDKEVQITGEQLKEFLCDNFNKSSKNKALGDELFEKINAFIDAKIDYAKNDLENKINKTGEYDPDW